MLHKIHQRDRSRVKSSRNSFKLSFALLEIALKQTPSLLSFSFPYQGALNIHCKLPLSLLLPNHRLPRLKFSWKFLQTRLNLKETTSKAPWNSLELPFFYLSLAHYPCQYFKLILFLFRNLSKSSWNLALYNKLLLKAYLLYIKLCLP